VKPTRRTSGRGTLQHTATHCNTLHHTATRCSTLFDWCCFYYFLRNSLVALLEALSARTTHCNTLQYTAIHYNTLQQTDIVCLCKIYHTHVWQRCTQHTHKRVTSRTWLSHVTQFGLCVCQMCIRKNKNVRGLFMKIGSLNAVWSVYVCVAVGVSSLCAHWPL